LRCRHGGPRAGARGQPSNPYRANRRGSGADIPRLLALRL